MSQTKPLPKFDQIKIENIPPASALLFYGGNKITEWYANHRYHHPYKPAAFHAALYIENGLTLNVGAFKTILDLKKEFISTRRIDVIVYKNLTDVQRNLIRRQAYLDADKPKLGIDLPTYGFFDFMRFEPLLRKFIPETKKDICSENVTKRFLEAGYKISDFDPARTAPWHLFEYALAHADTSDVKTVWTGLEFKN